MTGSLRLPSFSRLRAGLLGVLLKGIAALPWPAQRWLGARLGDAFYALSARRRRIARRNLERCFPALDGDARLHLLRENFRETGRGSLEVALAWFGSAARLQALTRLEGLEHVQAAQASGRGVIVLGFHYTTLELASCLLARALPLHGMYRPNNNPDIDALINHGRLRSFRSMISRFQPRAMLKALKAGEAVLYLPDQDLGRRDSLFVPFFGIDTAWVTGIARFAAMSGAAVVPLVASRHADGLHLRLLPALDGFPSGNEEECVRADLTRVSQLLEQQLRAMPANYLWVHRRFKTRPDGEAGFYGK